MRDEWGPCTYDALMTRVLLAEDDQAISEPLARALRREGYEVEGVGDGSQALALRMRRFLVRRVPRERIRYRLGTLRARALRR